MYISEDLSEQGDLPFFHNPVLRRELLRLFRQATLPDERRNGKEKKRKMLFNTIDIVLRFPAEREKILRTIELCRIENNRKKPGTPEHPN